MLFIFFLLTFTVHILLSEISTDYLDINSSPINRYDQIILTISILYIQDGSILQRSTNSVFFQMSFTVLHSCVFLGKSFAKHTRDLDYFF